MAKKFRNLSTDTTLGGNAPSDTLAVSQRAIKTYVDSQSGGGSGSAQSVGNVFWTMRTDNELNGAVECNGATYNTTDFSGTHSIGTLLAGGKIPYVSLATYATLLSTQGSVGVFGWDGIGTTAFRVPSLEDIFIETGTAAQIGDYLAPKIPNIKGYVTNITSKDQPASSGALYSSAFSYDNLDNTKGNDDGNSTINIDASRSSGVYDDTATTVQPNAVRYRAMVQLAAGATDEAVETCTGVLADVANLKDLSNITATGKATAVSWGVPDYASVIAADGVAPGTWVQCAVDSFVCTYGSDPYMENYSAYVSPDKSTKYIVGSRFDDYNGSTQTTSFTFFVPKGWWFQNNPENGFSYRIYPLKGAA